MLGAQASPSSHFGRVERSSTPRVSIGLPVFNGERFIRQAIESVLDQSFADLELIISDNASTDLTQKICEEYASRDGRVHYLRQRENIGAGPNFNVVLSLAKGEYFKWMAHDDVIDRSFIGHCVKVLDNDHTYVLASPKVKICNENLDFLTDYTYDLLADDPSPSKRFRHQIRGHQCYEVFGLIRREALQRTPGMRCFFGGDAALLLRLVILGRFYELPSYLFYSREHAGQSMKLKGKWQEYMVWFDPSFSGKITLPYWRLLSDYVTIVINSDLSASQRLRCGASVLGWAAQRWSHLTRDCIVAAVQVAYRSKRRIARTAFKAVY